MSKKKIPAVVQGRGGQLYTKSKKPKKRNEEVHVQRPIVRSLLQIEKFTGKLTFYHVPNQMMRTKSIRIIMAALGVRAGVPDLVICLGGGVTIYLELKYKDGKTNKNQNEYMDKLIELGHNVYVLEAGDSMEACRKLHEILAEHGLTDFSWDGVLR